MKKKAITKEFRYCEYHTDIIPKNRCKYLGFRTCQLYNKQLEECREGWRECCDDCETPFFVLIGYKNK